MIVTTARDRSSYATHEAGHVVIAEHFGGKLVFASADKFLDRDGIALSSFTAQLTLWQLAVRKAGGIAAELYRSGFSRHGSQDEADLAALGISIDAALRDAKAIIAAKEARFSAIEAALIQHGTVNGNLEPATDTEKLEAQNTVKRGAA